MAEINGVFIDNIVANQIPDIRNGVLKQDKDKHIVIDGREGSGKSALGMQLAKALDPEFNIDKIAFNGLQFMKLVKDPNRKKGDCILLDEAFNAASSRATLSEINRAMVGVATEMRQLNLFIIIILPTFFDLDRYFALWRCDTLFHVYLDKKGNRGQYVIFPFDSKLKLYVDGKKTYNYNAVKSPYPPCRFNKMWIVDEAEYRERKAAAFRTRKVSSHNKKAHDRFIQICKILHDEEHRSWTQIGEMVGETGPTIAKIVDYALKSDEEQRNINNNTTWEEEKNE